MSVSTGKAQFGLGKHGAQAFSASRADQRPDLLIGHRRIGDDRQVAIEQPPAVLARITALGQFLLHWRLAAPSLAEIASENNATTSSSTAVPDWASRVYTVAGSDTVAAGRGARWLAESAGCSYPPRTGAAQQAAPTYTDDQPPDRAGTPTCRSHRAHHGGRGAGREVSADAVVHLSLHSGYRNGGLDE